ncbi:MAG: glycerol-3-phosphate 1-O-acyltransferase PlsY [Gammaproteobacteria bacterium]|nr:glycerol-3-phosphate 1-O-acyltransferase PlsY [Gammaproteobacteria bacterium]
MLPPFIHILLPTIILSAKVPGFQTQLPTKVTLAAPESIILLLFSYLLGSLSSAIILSKIMGFTDPRTDGSNNPGATNVMRIAGKKAAFFTLLGDCLKGLIPVLLAVAISEDRALVALTGLSAFLGHCYPVYFQFKGGKGVATAIAVNVAFNWLVGLIIIGIWLVFAKVFRISSLAAIIAFFSLPALIFWREASLVTTLIFTVMSLILIWRHRANIQRLLQGTES